jgi:hypothetical protein
MQKREAKNAMENRILLFNIIHLHGMTHGSNGAHKRLMIRGTPGARPLHAFVGPSPD